MATKSRVMLFLNSLDLLPQADYKPFETYCNSATESFPPKARAENISFDRVSAEPIKM